MVDLAIIQAIWSLPGAHDPILVVISIAVAAVAAYTALDLVGRITAASGAARLMWLACGGAAMGLGIWSMHFIGMLALEAGVVISYDPLQWAASAALAMVTSIFGLHCVARSRVSGLAIARTGLLMGLGIAGVHYLGIAAMEFAGELGWDFGFVWASIGVAVIACVLVLALAYRLRFDESRRGHLLRAAAAALVGGAFAAMHYTAMAAATFQPFPGASFVPEHAVLATPMVAISVALGTLVVMGLALLGGVVDRELRRRMALASENAILYAVARVLAESTSLHVAIPALLQQVGSSFGWEFGAFWLPEPDGQTLRNAGIWIAPAVDDRIFAAVSREQRPTFGEGLPGLAWKEGRPVWMVGLDDPNRFPRAGAAAGAGLKSGIAFPIRVGDEVLGIFEFFDRSNLEPSPAMVDTLTAISRQIGQSMLRVRLEEQRDELLRQMETVNERLQTINEELAQRTAEAERARAAADEANRAKSDFLANMSHELRTPINAIVGYVDLLDLELAGPITEQQRQHLDRVRGSSRHLLSLIEDILDLAKIEAGRVGVEREPIEPTSVVSQALGLVFPLSKERGVELRNECTSPDVPVLADEGRVRQIIVNLLTNALKFTERGGHVVIRCETITGPPAGTILLGDGPWIGLSVEDTGVGIAPEEAIAIFQPFVQAEQGRTRKHGGTGLGLTISRQFARLMGGDLTLESELGRGSRFTLWIPSSIEATESEVDFAGAAERNGLAESGSFLLARVPAICRDFTRAIRADPSFVSAASITDTDLIDHQATLLSDIALSLLALEDSEASTVALLHDGSEIQQLIAERHGIQRARNGWSEEELEREFEILHRVIESAMSVEGGDSDLVRAWPIIRRMVERAEDASWRAYRGMVGANAPS